MDNQNFISVEKMNWSDFSWDGHAEKDGRFVRGQLIVRREPDGERGYYICQNPSLFKSTELCDGLIGWFVKVTGSSLRKTPIVEAFEAEVNLGVMGNLVEVHVENDKNTLNISLFKDGFHKDTRVINISDLFLQ